MISSVKSRFFLKIVPSLLLLVIPISSCGQTKPAFQSDEKMKLAFPDYKPELLSILKKCRLEKEIGGMKNHIQGSYNTCKNSPAQLKKVNVVEIATKVIRNYPKRPFTELTKNNSFLFVTDQNIEEGWGTYVEEKGYIFSTAPIKNDVITKGSLDEFRNTKIEDKSEKWRFIPIEPNWYLYYRQYRHSYP